MLKNKRLKHPNFTIISILFCLSVFTYIWVFRHPLKWDMIDYFLPTRYFLSECLHQFSLPLWNPYQSMGLPFHSDPQSGAWYPVAWLFSAIGYYGFYHLSCEYVFHIFIGSVGAFLLAKYIFNQYRVAFFMALAYLSCGFFVSNAQHLSWIISGAWIPFIFLFYLKFIDDQKIIDSLKVSFFLFLLFTGGYIAFSIVVFYLLFFIGLYKIFGFIIKKEYLKIYSFVWKNILLITAFCIFSAASLVSIVEALPFITRGSGLSIQKALENPFSVHSFISFVLPYTSVKSYDFFNTDSSMANAYFGIIPLIFVVYSFFLKPPKWIFALFIFSGLMLCLAVGDALPIREWAYYHLPFMNLFRFPSLFRLFVILAFLIIASWSFGEFLKNDLKPKKALWIILSIFILGFILLIIMTRYGAYIDLKHFVKNDSFRYSIQSTFSQHLVFQSFFQIFILVMFLTIVIWKNFKLKTYVIFFIITLDLLSATWLNTPYSIITKVFTLNEVEHKLDSFSHQYSIPKKITTYNEEKENHYGPLWQNLSTYSKNIPDDSYNPFALKSHTELLQSLKNNNCELYIPKFVFSPKVFLQINENSLVRGVDTVYLNYSNVRKFEYDSINVGLKMMRFKPGKMEININALNNDIIVIAQNYYPHWYATIDNNVETRMFAVNFNMTAVEVPKGNYNLTLEYRPILVIIMFWISACFILLFGLYLVYYKYRNVIFKV